MQFCCMETYILVDRFASHVRLGKKGNMIVYQMLNYFSNVGNMPQQCVVKLILTVFSNSQRQIKKT